MADLEFEVAKRRTKPITFSLGGGNALLTPAVEADEEAGVEGQAEVRGADDHEYSFVPPKSALMLMPVIDGSAGGDGLAVTKATFDWLGDGLSLEDQKRINDRLKDGKDDLDIDTVSEVIKALSERASGGRPTT